MADVGVVSFAGADAEAFLQGYLTCDMEAVGDAPVFTAMCNIKGRTLLTGYVCREGGAVMLVLHRTLCAPTLDFLRPYLAFSKTRAVDATDGCTVVGAMDVGLGPPALHLDARRQLAVFGREESDQAARLLAANTQLGLTDWRDAAIAKREVWLQAATSGMFLPQMLALDELGAISFTKGCYLGQEVVARAQHRGEVKRRLTSLRWRGATMPVGAKIREADGRVAGVLVAVAGEGAGPALAVLAKNANPPFSAEQGATVLGKV